MSTYRAIEAPSLSKSFDEGIQKLRLVSKVRVPLKPNEVRVKVIAAAVNFFDLLMLVGKYQAKPVFPFVPVCNSVRFICSIIFLNYLDHLFGAYFISVLCLHSDFQGSEAAGEVVEIGSNVKGRKVGDAVIVMLAPSCFAEEVVVG
jgi:NADPH2:quinone reductase